MYLPFNLQQIIKNRKTLKSKSKFLAQTQKKTGNRYMPEKKNRSVQPEINQSVLMIKILFCIKHFIEFCVRALQMTNLRNIKHFTIVVSG